jgi:hypothetical protein
MASCQRLSQVAAPNYAGGTLDHYCRNRESVRCQRLADMEGPDRQFGVHQTGLVLRRQNVYIFM